MSAIGLLVLLHARPWLIPDAPDERAHELSPAFALPPRTLWVLGALGDGSGLYLRDYLGTGKGYAALGYAAFSVTMLIGRFSGDRVVERFGSSRMIRAGGLLAAGLGIAVIVNDSPAMLFGFGAVGLGLSSIYPLVFSAAGNHPTLSRGQAVAGVATIGYAGFLAGPPALGWIAAFTSLRAIMAVIVLLAALAATLTNAARFAGLHRQPGPAEEPASGLEVIA